MLQFCHTQLPIRFRNRALAMDPFGLDPIEPGALNRQGTHHQATAAGLLDVPVVRLEPGPHGLADVPRGIVPDQQQGGFAFGGVFSAEAGESGLEKGEGPGAVEFRFA